jgi:hypothetical protein
LLSSQEIFGHSGLVYSARPALSKGFPRISQTGACDIINFRTKVEKQGKDGMSRVKELFLYVLALIVLLAPAIILGWVGLTLLGWVGLIIGILAGLAIFAFSVNKIANQEDFEEEPPVEGAEAVDQPGPVEEAKTEMDDSISPATEIETTVAEPGENIVAEPGETVQEEVR